MCAGKGRHKAPQGPGRPHPDGPAICAAWQHSVSVAHIALRGSTTTAGAHTCVLHGSTGGGEGLAHLLHSIPLAAPLGLEGLEAPQEARDPRGPLARLQPCVSGHLVGYHDVKLGGLASILDCGVGLQAIQAAPWGWPASKRQESSQAASAWPAGDGKSCRPPCRGLWCLSAPSAACTCTQCRTHGGAGVLACRRSSWHLSCSLTHDTAVPAGHRPVQLFGQLLAGCCLCSDCRAGSQCSVESFMSRSAHDRLACSTLS